MIRYASTHLTGQHTGFLESLVNLTFLQVILRFLSFHLLIKLLLVLHLFISIGYVYKLVYVLTERKPTSADVSIIVKNN